MISPTPLPNDQVQVDRQLFRVLLGLSIGRARITGLSTRKLATLAQLPSPRAVTESARRLADRGVIAFEPGTFRKAHTYTIIHEVSPAYRERCAQALVHQ